jgi:hypothetical protein
MAQSTTQSRRTSHANNDNHHLKLLVTGGSKEYPNLSAVPPSESVMSSGLGYIMDHKMEPHIDNQSPYAVSKFPGSKPSGAKMPFKNTSQMKIQKQHEIKTTGILASFP